MENLILSFNVVAPMMLMMIMGVIFKRFSLLTDETCSTLNTLTYKILIPCSVFCSVYRGDLSEMMDLRPVLFGAGALTAVFLIMMVAVRFAEPSIPRRGVMAQAAIRSNFVIFGLPVARALLGDSNLSVIMLMIVLLAPFYNLLAVLCFSLNGEKKPNLKQVAKDIVTNPIIISSVIAMIFLFFKIPLPEFVDKTVSSFGDMASPIAFMILGATFSFKMKKDVARTVFSSVFIRLVLIPAVFIPLSILCGFRGAPLVGLAALFGAPTAVSSYALATHMDGDGESAAKIIVYSSCFSMLTMFVIIFILKHFAFI